MSDVFAFTSVTRVTPSGGTIAGGTAVTITGFGFDFATGGVTFGGSAFTVTSITNTTITGTTPAHNVGAVDVVVAGVGTGVGIYTYSNPATLLMPPVPVTADGKLDVVATPKWLMVAKQRIETADLVDSGSIIGPITVAQVPQLPFTKIDLTNSPRLLGRTTAGAGAAEEIEVAAGLTLSGGILSLSGLPGGYVIGDLLYADSANSLARLADVSVGSYLRSGGVATAPLWSTLKLPNAATTGDILYATATNSVDRLADVATGAVIISGGIGVVPSYSRTPQVDKVTFAKVDGANTVLWGQHDPTIYGTVGIAVGNVGGVKLGATYQPVRFTSGPVLEPIYIDDTWHIGSNVGTLAGGVGRADITKPMVALSFESKFFFGTNFGQEVHIQGVTTDGLTTFRPLSFFIAHDASAITGATSADTFTMGNKAGVSILQASNANAAVDLGTAAAPIKLRGNKNNTSYIQQLNAAGSGFIDLMYLDASNVIQLGASTAITGPRVGANFVLVQPATGNNNDSGIAVSAPTFTGVYQGIKVVGSVTGKLHSVIENDAAAGGAHASLTLQVSDGSGGDPYIYFAVPGVTNWSLGCDNSDSDKFVLSGASTVGATNRLVVQTDGNVGIGVSTPTAVLHIKAGTTAASSAPLKFNSGSLLTTAEAGAHEFLTDDFYLTITTGAARKGIVLNDGTALTATRVPFATTNGRLTDDSDMTFATDTLTVTKLSAPTSVSTGTLAQTGKTTTYNNVNTAGWGAPAIYGSGRATGQTAAVASVATYTVGASDGSFDVSANVNVTTSTTHNFTAECAYTDETNTARVQTLTLSQLAGVFVTAITNVTGAGPYNGVPLSIRCKASTAITIRTQAAGTYTAVTFNVEGTIAQVA
jgi:hypothetical protein